MRYVIYGAGAIGGGVGARLHDAGEDVTLIARGAHYEVVARDGLTVQTPDSERTLRVPVVDRPEAIEFTPGHVVLLTMKSQDTLPALAALAAVAPPGTPVVCMQNGVANERMALRRFEHVYGAVVMMPGVHLEPGIVQLHGTPKTGIVDLGVYPSGVDDRARELAGTLASATFNSLATDAIMPAKYAKLLANLGNAVQAICGPEADAGELTARARDEGRAALQSAGIEFDSAERVATRRWDQFSLGAIAGQKRGGGSTWQSLTRGTSVETDYLNGEVALLGRLYGVKTPVNALLQQLMRTAARERRKPGWLTPDEILARLG